ncbi:hypothetical protein [Hymenobacter jeollabukensis]|uniref:Uncharacterized protein n=1 Tax=Hymenobacter jeollabukensis TaxID=2025313 RepID=A0A5R8WHK8_9BACT|nr:hypothetical protein [Hymenobacter jeollabukensis]TLM87400.1 hypothetical protein FDY95_25735 [Hymenobacter jeollabukensis]
MGFIYCRCGQKLSNTSFEESAPRTADFVPATQMEAAGALAEQRLLALLAAVRRGESIAQHMSWPDAPSVEVQQALLTWHLFGEPTDNFSREIIQCDACGRLLVQIGQTNHYTTFLPEEPEKARRILSADDWHHPTEPDEPDAE